MWVGLTVGKSARHSLLIPCARDSGVFLACRAEWSLFLGRRQRRQGTADGRKGEGGVAVALLRAGYATRTSIGTVKAVVHV